MSRAEQNLCLWLLLDLSALRHVNHSCLVQLQNSRSTILAMLPTNDHEFAPLVQRSCFHALADSFVELLRQLLLCDIDPHQHLVRLDHLAILNFAASQESLGSQLLCSGTKLKS